MLQQRLDFRFSSPVEHGRSHEYSTGQCVCDSVERLVVVFRHGVREGRVLKQRLQLSTNRIRLGVLCQDFAHLGSKVESSPAEMRFQNLAYVHTGRYAKWIQHDLHW